MTLSTCSHASQQSRTQKPASTDRGNRTENQCVRHTRKHTHTLTTASAATAFRMWLSAIRRAKWGEEAMSAAAVCTQAIIFSWRVCGGERRAH